MGEKIYITVVGAGVSGLTTALVLTQDPNLEVTIIAKYIPGDEAVDYTSPWAGANYLPTSTQGSREAEWDAAAFKALSSLADSVPEAGISWHKAFLWNRKTDCHTDVTDWFKELISVKPWFTNMLPDFQVLPQSELPPGFVTGTSFKTLCINVPVYLEYLVSRVKAAGVVIKKDELSHIADAVDFHASGKKADFIINCTGLAAAKLGGVQDRAVFPARGQIVLVRNQISALYTTSGTDDGPFETMYVHPRVGGGTVIGGSYQKNDWNGEVDVDLGQRIMERAVRLCPELTAGQGIEALDVIRQVVGLRPVRTGGPRLEKEVINGVTVVHNYGHGGCGYQCSYGCAAEVANIVKTCTDEKCWSQL